ncbi:MULTISPECIES: DUF4352 domain-containing protein [Haloferax]|uniref:DUF4352 domain-containing protein n=2 Tax=Haloferax TaxID=2251 RepID=A0A6G1Z0Z0_9EURY|nr:MULTISPECIES: DUF4352 domain-containing protein [Haloferax]KAB1187503.1 DUF4352 domain-containing protein [Haloferax sp. CBA1149]MRW80155.1 DUF4352 domain-containing protein [Haloferax marinisediminis]
MNRRHYIGLCGGALAGLSGCTSDEQPEQVTNTPETTNGDSSGNQGRAEGTTVTQTETPTEQVAEAKIGEVVEDNTLAMIVKGVEKTEKIGRFQEADSGKTYVVADLAIKNRTSDEFIGFSGLLQTRLKDDEDYTYDQTFASTGKNLDGGQIAPGEVSRGDIVYEVPKDASGLIMQFDFQAVSLFKFSRVEIDLAQSADSIAELEQNLQVDMYGPGDSVKFNETVVTVNGIETETSLGSFAKADEGNEFVIIDITTTNNTSEELNISTLLQMLLKDGEGYSYPMSITALSALDRGYEQGSPLASGETRRGKVPYEVPEGKSPLYWAFEFSVWVDGTKTFWQVR